MQSLHRATQSTMEFLTHDLRAETTRALPADPATIPRAARRSTRRRAHDATRTTQSTMTFPTHGGARRGAGRPRLSPRPSVPHVARPELRGRNPLHVTLKLVDGLPSLRSREAQAHLREALRAGADRNGFRLIHYGALSNHLHLVCEANSERA